MLRRNPTALTISPEDLSTFEELHARKLAFARYKATGEDPLGLFTTAGGASTYTQQLMEMGSGRDRGPDPSDELKPLPGDKARIVRGREERIMGVGSGGAGTAGTAGGNGR